MQQIGVLKIDIGKSLGFQQTEDIPVYIGPTNIAHIQNKHPKLKITRNMENTFPILLHHRIMRQLTQRINLLNWLKNL